MPCCPIGMPLISDPGSGLVAAAAAAGHPVIPIAGPSAFLLALVASGLSSSKFTFVGFLPDKAKRRQEELQDLAGAAHHSGPPMCVCDSAVHAWLPRRCYVCFVCHVWTTHTMESADLTHTLVFYVPPHDLLAVLRDAVQILGAERKCVVARELTKVPCA